MVTILYNPLIKWVFYMKNMLKEKEEVKRMDEVLEASKRLLRKWEQLADDQAKKQGVVFKEEEKD